MSASAKGKSTAKSKAPRNMTSTLLALSTVGLTVATQPDGYTDMDPDVSGVVYLCLVNFVLFRPQSKMAKNSGQIGI
jgi:hypothetical protein